MELSDNNTERKDSGGLTHDVSKNKDSIRNLDRSHLCDIGAKNVASFCPYPEIQCEGEFKDSGLICLAEEILRKNAIQAEAEETITIH